MALASRATDVSFDFKNLAGGADYFRLSTSTNRLKITPLEAPFICNGLLIGADPMYYLPSTNGTGTMTNLCPSRYLATIRIKEKETSFQFVVTNSASAVPLYGLTSIATNAMPQTANAYTIATAGAIFIVQHGAPTDGQVLTYDITSHAWWPSNSVSGAGGNGNGDVTTAQLSGASNVLYRWTGTVGTNSTNYAVGQSNSFYSIITNAITVTSNGLIVYIVGQSNAFSTRLLATNTALLSFIGAQGTTITNALNSKMGNNSGLGTNTQNEGQLRFLEGGVETYRMYSSATNFFLEDLITPGTPFYIDYLKQYVSMGRLSISAVTNSGPYIGTLVSAKIAPTNATASRLVTTTTTGILTNGAATATEADFLSGVTAAIQSQFTAGTNNVTDLRTAFQTVSNNFLTVSNNFLSVSNAHVAASNQVTVLTTAVNAASNSLVIVSNTANNKVAMTNGQAYGLTLNGVTTNNGTYYNPGYTLLYSGTAGVTQTNVNVDFSTNTEFYLLLTNTARIIPINMRPFQVVNIEIWEDGTGSRAVTFDPLVTTNAGGLNLTNTANARNVLTLKAGKYGTNVFGVMQAGFQ